MRSASRWCKWGPGKKLGLTQVSLRVWGSVVRKRQAPRAPPASLPTIPLASQPCVHAAVKAICPGVTVRVSCLPAPYRTAQTHVERAGVLQSPRPHSISVICLPLSNAGDFLVGRLSLIGSSLGPCEVAICF